MRQRSAAAPDRPGPEQRASTWLQVVFGGMSVTITLVAAVIAYFAWVRPHAPPGQPAAGTGGVPTTVAGTGPATSTGTVANANGADAVRISTLEPTLGGTNVRRAGTDLVMPRATGQTTDRQRTVEYDLLGRYATAAAALTVTKARDGESPAQLTILADGLVAATVTVTRNDPGRLNVTLAGKQKMRLQLTC